MITGNDSSTCLYDHSDCMFLTMKDLLDLIYKLTKLWLHAMANNGACMFGPIDFLQI